MNHGSAHLVVSVKRFTCPILPQQDADVARRHQPQERVKSRQRPVVEVLDFLAEYRRAFALIQALYNLVRKDLFYRQ